MPISEKPRPKARRRSADTPAVEDTAAAQTESTGSSASSASGGETASRKTAAKKAVKKTAAKATAKKAAPKATAKKATATATAKKTAKKTVKVKSAPARTKKATARARATELESEPEAETPATEAPAPVAAAQATAPAAPVEEPAAPAEEVAPVAVAHTHPAVSDYAGEAVDDDAADADEPDAPVAGRGANGAVLLEERSTAPDDEVVGGGEEDEEDEAEDAPVVPVGTLEPEGVPAGPGPAAGTVASVRSNVNTAEPVVLDPPLREGENEFTRYGLMPELVKACEAAGFKAPSEIQRRLIPVAMTGKDVLGQSKTGSGKTAAFLLPILTRLGPENHVQALILTPTRELAQQIQEECRKLTRFAPVRSVAVIGGKRMQEQLDGLRKGAKIVIGTPGRILDHMGRRTIDFTKLRFAVLDEVDRMLDIGFRDDIRQILKSIRQKHQTIFVSATISDEIAKLAGQFMHEPEKVYLAPDDLTVPQVQQYYVSVERPDKYRLLKMILEKEQPRLCIIFSGTKRMADELADRMARDGLNAVEIHGDLQQAQREKVMARFRKGDIRFLVATDLASRGLDIPEVSLIINYDIPLDAESYVHRIGRTARMGATGKAITLVTGEEGPQLTQIEMLINKEVGQLRVEGFTPSVAASKPVEPAPPPKPRLSRFVLPVFQELAPTPDGSPVRLPAKGLGGKFLPSRRRRR
jgi:ATP-dependent RNA helicase DeaD